MSGLLLHNSTHEEHPGHRHTRAHTLHTPHTSTRALSSPRGIPHTPDITTLNSTSENTLSTPSQLTSHRMPVLLISTSTENFRSFSKQRAIFTVFLNHLTCKTVLFAFGSFFFFNVLPIQF